MSEPPQPSPTAASVHQFTSPPRLAASASPDGSPPVVVKSPPPHWLLLLLLVLVPLLSVNNFFAYHAPGAVGSSMQAMFGSLQHGDA